MTADQEEWRAVIGYEGFYEVSDQGRVRSVKREIVFSDGRVRTFPSKLLKSWVNPNTGRNEVGLSVNQKCHTARVYVLVMAAFVGPCPDGKIICHSDGDRTNDALGNLRYGTYSSNNQDTVRHGMHHHARKTTCAKGHPLTPDNIYRRKDRPGSRACATCHKAEGQARYRRRAAAS